MARKSNLYHNLVKNEDTLTELLANLLQFPAFKEFFTTFLANELSLSNFSFLYADVETQQALSEQGRPDLIIKNASFCVAIECKVDNSRGLTDHQPGSYLNYLAGQASKICTLVFLIPDYYRYEGLILERAATCGTKVPLKLIYWTDLIERLEDSKIADQNIAIEHFVALLQARFAYQPIILSPEEIMLLQNQEFPAALLKLFKLINEIGDKFPISFKLEHLSNEYGFGYYVKNQKGQYLLWFGCSYDFWKDYGKFLAVGVGADEDQDFSPEVINSFRAYFGQEATWYEPWEWYAFPLPENLIKDPQNVKKLVQFITEAATFCDTA